ncbi:MAG TPA: hypothetical protein DEA28_00530 [Firmicutes bacterium]|nr:hypothetical protein [Bacillota bacterium]
MTVNVINGKLSDNEKNAYWEYALKHSDGKQLKSLDVKVDGDYVDLTYHFETIPFERIRRITGYLVGTLDRFNDGKRSEEHDRVKHMTRDDL